MARARVAEANKGIGKPLVGGAFHLTDHNGKDFTAEDLKGKYSLVYFGFTHCPDICPEELDKMAGMIDQVKEKHGEGVMRNVFISCDPARDTPEVIRRYLAEFHEDILGMTGTWQEVKDVCKAYRVYFSTPADVQPGQDYLVDHSIYFYLMGKFGNSWWTCNDDLADFDAQILRATLLRPLDVTSQSMPLRRSSTITSPTGGARLTGHEECTADVDEYVRYCKLYVESHPYRNHHRSLVELPRNAVPTPQSKVSDCRFMSQLYLCQGSLTGKQDSAHCSGGSWFAEVPTILTLVCTRSASIEPTFSIPVFCWVLEHLERRILVFELLLVCCYHEPQLRLVHGAHVACW
jgi:cytochrome oxidase Cu insertion factor (SCO1/SenC/PrrC family)